MSLRDHRLVLNRGVNRVKSRGITVCINISKEQKKEANDEPKTKGSTGEEGGWKCKDCVECSRMNW